MVRKITDKKILKLLNNLDNEAIKKVLLKEDNDFFAIKFIRQNEQVFRSLIPDFYDEYIKFYSGIDSRYCYANRDQFMTYVCLNHGVVNPKDFESVKNFKTAGIETYMLSHCEPSSLKLFKDGVLNTKDGDKKLVAFVDENPEYVDYFLPLICSVDNDVFFAALTNWIQSAQLQDTLRINIFEAMLESSDKAMALRCLDAIEANNYYRFKALNEACVMVGDYTTVLAPKDLVAVLRDAAAGNCEKYINADFKRAFHFINAYDRMYEAQFRSFAIDVLERGGDRARWALLNSLSVESINKDYVLDIFTDSLTLEDLSFFIYRINADYIDMSVLPKVFDTLFSILISMNKVCYHYKTDDDINFARDLFKSTVVSKIAKIAVRLGDEYVQKLDGIYNTLKEEAQAAYLCVVKDRTALDVRACAIKFLKTDNYESVNFFDESKIKLTYDEAVSASDYLKSKKQTVKSKITKVFLSSPESEKIAQYLVSCNEEYKKSVGEEMQKSSGKIDSVELVKKTERFSWWSNSVFKVDRPDDEIKNIAMQDIDVSPIKAISLQRAKDFFKAIKDFIEVNKDYEYETYYSDGLAQLGSKFERVKGCEQFDFRFEQYPLGSKIKEILRDNFQAEELAGILALIECAQKCAKKLYCAASGNSKDSGEAYEYAASLNKGRWYEVNEFNVAKQLDAAIAEELLSDKELIAIIAAFTRREALDKYEKSGSSDKYPRMFGRLLLKGGAEPNLIKTMLRCECSLLNEGIIDSINYNLIAEAYENGFISDRLARYFIQKQGFAEAFLPTSPDCIMRSDYKKKKYKAMMIDCMEEALNVEFSRGSLQTLYSDLLRRSVKFFGAEKYFKAIVALRGLTWVRSPYGNEKNETLSIILKNTVKGENDDYATFCELIKKYDITDDELIKATLFNPEFVDYTAKYLQVPHLKIAVFWFIAHLNETLESEKQERRIEQIREFSDVSYQDFKDGAFDCKWYKEMVDKVPADMLKRIYDNAKYVTVGGLHKRAQRFFDAMNSKISKAECIEKINTARNKDYCLIYSLIPIEDNADLYQRYIKLAEFAKSAKQFGAQRQLSERRTVDIALENLARVAGYASSDIFIFEMEAQEPSDIFKTFEVDGIEITPYIDQSKFKIAYKVQKDGKALSSIPSKYGKDQAVVSLREQIKTLNQKLRRVITGFENAMNTRVEFRAQQLENMSRESIIHFVLTKLLLISDGRLCIFDGKLKDIDGRAIEADSVYVAHPVELKKLGLLSRAIEYVASRNIRQPFKQALREIYVKTDIELTQDEVLRFKGFEVDVKKCVAALKSRGWGVSEDIGLRKVHYRCDTVAAIFREFDFFYTADYTNVNKELHGIYFLKRKSGEIIALKDVDDVTFSETLRDVDLMIAISSKVIYDFELAMSTVEMRQEVLKSIVKILGLSNVSFLKDNIKVEGKLGTYVVNIRTGLVFKEGKGNLAIDTVYSVDKLLLLDFVDEDPMTADIISKAIVLANDDRIKDAAILREIKD